ncbi:hypothetical protein [Aliarcobacter butzleri]|uniref:hypothetical protein n=1 Tax=Aliarcobacter butzleri TaxID=28197 RepID=UPI001ED9ED5E|nr:hypothetical protein [Aliarcobacter butzleri]MCG3658585.1 hypothetical protein [Aliarcobacter butzleri]
MKKEISNLEIKPYSQLVIDAAEDICKGAYNFGLFALNVFYRESSIKALKESFDAYQIEKLSQVIEDFQYEHSKIDDDKKREFYEDLKYNKQNLEFLYSLFEKSRKSTYIIHMKLLAYLSRSLVNAKELNYQEKTLLSSIDILNDEDLIHFYKVLDGINMDIDIANINKTILRFSISTYDEYYIFEKILRAGLIIEHKHTAAGGLSFYKPNDKISQDRSFIIHNFTVEIYDFLDLILGDNNSY